MRRRQRDAVDGLADVIVSIPRNEDTVPVVSIGIRGSATMWCGQIPARQSLALNCAGINLSAPTQPYSASVSPCPRLASPPAQQVRGVPQYRDKAAEPRGQGDPDAYARYHGKKFGAIVAGQSPGRRSVHPEREH